MRAPHEPPSPFSVERALFTVKLRSFFVTGLVLLGCGVVTTVIRWTPDHHSDSAAASSLQGSAPVLLTRGLPLEPAAPAGSGTNRFGDGRTDLVVAPVGNRTSRDRSSYPASDPSSARGTGAAAPPPSSAFAGARLLTTPHAHWAEVPQKSGAVPRSDANRGAEESSFSVRSDPRVVLNELLSIDQEDLEVAQTIQRSLPDLTGEEQTVAAQQMSALVPDERYASFSEILIAGRLPKPVLAALLDDVTIRGERVRFPTLLAVAENTAHPLATEAAGILNRHLGTVAGGGSASWRAAMAQRSVGPVR